jgi:hypothetical protein
LPGRAGKLIARGGCAVGAEVANFDDLVRRHRRELHVYCYRTLPVQANRQLAEMAAFEQPSMFTVVRPAEQPVT